MVKEINIRKILFIGLSNIGDAVLTLPVLDYLRDRFPEAYIVVMSGPRPQEIFQDKKVINELIVYDKHSPAKEKIKLIKTLRKKNFDAIVDLRNTAFPLFINYKLRTPFTNAPADILHMRNRHFWKIKKMFKVDRALIPQKHFLVPSAQDKDYVDKLINHQRNLVVVAPGARSHEKRWSPEGFTEVINRIKQELNKNIVLVGDEADKDITGKIAADSPAGIMDLAGRLNLKQLAYLISCADLILTNDSAVLHISSYLNRPIASLFGPTDFRKYGPWSSRNKIIYKNNIQLINPEEVFTACQEILSVS